MVWNDNVVRVAEQNSFFRQVLATGPHSQVVVMAIPPNGEIGNEVHAEVDQLLVIVAGTAEAVIDNTVRSPLVPGDLVHVPAGTWHNVVNTGPTDLKLYTVYAPPQHAPGTVHRTRADAQAAHAAARQVQPVLPSGV